MGHQSQCRIPGDLPQKPHGVANNMAAVKALINTRGGCNACPLDATTLCSAGAHPEYMCKVSGYAESPQGVFSLQLLSPQRGLLTAAVLFSTWDHTSFGIITRQLSHKAQYGTLHPSYRRSHCTAEPKKGHSDDK